MNSLGEECNELKKQYDACFNVWFSEQFLKGKHDGSSTVPCGAIFKTYQDCVKRAMREQKIELRELDGDYKTSEFGDSKPETSKS